MDIPWIDIWVILISTFVSIVAFVKWTFKYWERKNVPYLNPSLPMGNFEPPWAIKRGFHSTVTDIYKEFKSKGYKFGGVFSCIRPVFVPVDIDLLKRIMIKDFQHFVDRGHYFNEKTDPLSANIFRIGGEKWRTLRNKISPTFTSGKMKYMFQTVLDCGAGLELEINKMCDKNEPVDVKEMAALFTTNVIGSCAFGLDCDAFANPNNEFRVHTRDFFHGGLDRVIRNYLTLSFPKVCKMFGVRFFPTSITGFYRGVIKNVMGHRESGAVKRNDFVQLLVDIKTGAKNKEESFTFEEVAAQAFSFFLAGFETSSSTMTFAFHEMAKHQDIQDRVREEIRAVSEKHGGKITYDAIFEMTYLGQIFDETLRKYPIVATLDRVVTKDYNVPDTDIVLKKGTHVLIPLRGIQNDPDYFPDPDKFDPERFLPENKENLHPCVYMPFGEGPRICVGMRFGIMQAKIGMALMLKNFRYKINSKFPEMKLYNKAPFLSPDGQVLMDIERVD